MSSNESNRERGINFPSRLIIPNDKMTVVGGSDSKGICSPDRYKLLPLIIALPGLILSFVLFRDRLHEALTPTDISSPLLRSGTVSKAQVDGAHQSIHQVIDDEASDEISGSEDVATHARTANVIIASSKNAISQGSIHTGIVKSANQSSDEENIDLLQSSIPISKAEPTQGKISLQEPAQKNEEESDITKSSKCQIVYVLGVEGSGHHGVSDVLIQTLASEQDGLTLKFRDNDFRRIMTARDSGEIATKMKEICNPNEKTVIVEDTSFPTGLEYRKIYAGRPAMDVAAILDIKPHPLDLLVFVNTFSTHADIKFVILHRPFFSIAVSHSEYSIDGGIIGHGEVMSGHMRYLGKLFKPETLGGKVDWMLLCTERLRTTERDAVVSELADFLGWNKRQCDHCFDKWIDSRKNPFDVAGKDVMAKLEEQKAELQNTGLWPPGREGEIQPRCLL